MVKLLSVIKKFFIFKMDSEDYIMYLRKCGIQIGGGCRIFDPKNTVIDIQNPHMITIGKNVRITRGCILLTHDYSWSVLAGVYGEILGGVGYLDIGDNVFIGMNSIILKNTSIGDNVIIGAGSIVSGKIESNAVYAGNPARKIMSIEDYYKKRKKSQLEELDYLISRYRKVYGEKPDESILKEYFWLYADRDKELSSDYFGLIKRTGYEDFILEQYRNTEKSVDLNSCQ